jgi:hypothetical protein
MEGICEYGSARFSLHKSCKQKIKLISVKVGQGGSTPKELFDDFIAEEKENFKRQKGTLKQIIKVDLEIMIIGLNVFY